MRREVEVDGVLRHFAARSLCQPKEEEGGGREGAAGAAGGSGQQESVRRRARVAIGHSSNGLPPPPPPAPSSRSQGHVASGRVASRRAAIASMGAAEEGEEVRTAQPTALTSSSTQRERLIMPGGREVLVPC